MKAKEQLQLIHLLHIYMNEIGEKLIEGNQYENYGLKAQFEHARILSTKVSANLNRKMEWCGIKEDK